MSKTAFATGATAASPARAAAIDRRTAIRTLLDRPMPLLPALLLPLLLLRKPRLPLPPLLMRSVLLAQTVDRRLLMSQRRFHLGSQADGTRRVRPAASNIRGVWMHGGAIEIQRRRHAVKTDRRQWPLGTASRGLRSGGLLDRGG